MAAKQKVEDLENDLCGLIPLLPDSVGRGRLVGIWFSLKAARELGYQRDDFRRRPTMDRNDLLPKIARSQTLDPSSQSPETKEWIAGYYFNNALLRMAMLAEIGLKVLFEKHSQIAPPDDYLWLDQWYEQNWCGSLSHLKRARQELNVFRHGPRTEKDRKIESFEDGLKAFSELITVLRKITEA